MQDGYERSDHARWERALRALAVGWGYRAASPCGGSGPRLVDPALAIGANASLLHRNGARLLSVSPATDAHAGECGARR